MKCFEKNLLPDKFEPFKLAKGSFLIVNWLSVYLLHKFGSVLALEELIFISRRKKHVIHVIILYIR